MDRCTAAGALEIWKILETDVAPLTRDAKQKLLSALLLRLKNRSTHPNIIHKLRQTCKYLQSVILWFYHLILLCGFSTITKTTLTFLLLKIFCQILMF